MNAPRPLLAALASLTISLSVFAQAITFKGKVINVIDGDTVTVISEHKSQYTVKCLGADAPPEEQAYGPDSRQRLAALLLNKSVLIEYSSRDQHGNIVGKIRLNGRDVCLNQIQEGFAWHDKEDASLQTASERERYALAESTARTDVIGLWMRGSTTPPSEHPATGAIENQPPALITPSQVPSHSQPSTSTSTGSPSGSSQTSATGTVNVRGYFRKDGTYVESHRRTAPDGNFDNNWSTYGNINPDTGKLGTKRRSWFRRNWGFVVTPLVVTGLYFSLKNLNGLGGIPCNDGTVSQAANRQGACSHHGGIVPGR
jgi:endonuclease YncB( thermonuclease family)